MTREERLLLLRCVCSLAWVDGQVQPAERAFLQELIGRIGLPSDEAQTALSYLEAAPHPAQATPERIPERHRQLFLTLAQGMIHADMTLTPGEQKAMESLEQLLLPPGHERPRTET